MICQLLTPNQFKHFLIPDKPGKLQLANARQIYEVEMLYFNEFFLLSHRLG